MLNNYAESGSGFNSNHGQTTRPTEAAPKQHNIGSSWSSYNSQLEGMYYGTEQAMYMGPYDGGSGKHANYPQYPHQPVPTPVVKCQEACCQHFQERYPLNPAPLRYQPTQPRYDDSRQYFTDRRSMQPGLSRKKAYPTDSAFPISDRHYSQFMGRGQFMPDSRQQMQMMRSQYPMYPPYWGSTRGYGPRMNCPPPPYHQSVSQGAQLQAGLKMADAHYMDPTQKSLGGQRHRTVGPSGGSEIIRPVPEPKRSALDPSLQGCYEFGYPGGFVPFGEVNKIQGAGVTQNGSSSCKIPSDKQYHPHQMQYSMQASDRSMMNCSNPINDLSYSMNFSLPSGDPYIRAGLDDGQSLSDSRKSNLQYDSSLGKKRPDLDLRQYLATWEDDEEEGTRLSEPVTLGNSGAPYIVVDCRSLEGEAAAKLQERFKTPSQNCSSKSRSSSPNGDGKRSDEQTRPSDNAESTSLSADFQNQTAFAPSMPNLINENDKGVNFWNGTERDGESISGKGSAFQPLDCSKRDNNLDHNKRDPQTQIEMPASKAPSNNETGNLSFDNLVSYYGDTRRTTDGGYDFVEMTERLVNNPDKSAVNNHQIPPSMTRPCDPRLQQSHMGNNPSIYNKVAPRYSASNFPHFKPTMPPDPYYNFKHPMNPSKYFGYDNSQVIDPNYEYHKIASEFDPARLYSNRDATKDPRRLFHPELDKGAENAFLDPVRKAQLSDCYQDKTPCEFTNGDPEQFMSPIIVKKSDHNRDKVYSDKSNSIRERMDVINNENQNLPEKTVLITSQNGPPEIFRVPYSPEKELSNKDNVVTLHSGDQTKSNTITVEVPYVQQYSTLVKLSEEISRVENVDGKSKAKQDETSSSNKSPNDETKKPTSFKLKRLPNSKEWAVENKGFCETNKRVAPENNTVDLEKSPRYEVLGERDSLKPPVTTSNLNMPSLDDFREDENCDTGAENLSKNKTSDNPICASNICSGIAEDSNKNNKYSSQLPQMAIVQPMKLNKCDGNQLETDRTCKLAMNDCKDGQLNKPLSSVNNSNSNQNSFDSELISSTSTHLDTLIPENDISKHGNFRTHKKIQSFPTRIPNCLPSPSEEFLHSQEIGAESQKETYSPFHVYSDCDMNSQINEFFKMDERNTSSDKILDSRMPSSPGVEGMFEDINHTNPSHTYQPKSCDFPDLSDPTINSHNAHFQSFSTIFSDDADRSERLDGSVLQMNDKKCFKNMLEDMKNQELTKPIDSLDHEKSDDSKKSPPIPPISLKLKLNESKKMWCIANKNQHLSDQTDVCTNELSVESRNLTHETLDIDAASELEKDLAQAIDEEKRKSSENYYGEVQGYSEINQLLSNGTSEGVTSHIISESNILAESILVDQNTSEYSKTTKIDLEFPEITENKCLTITKYCPKNKILKRINSFHGIHSRPSKTLVFDQYGTHFPVIWEETLSEAKSVAKDIIDDLLLKLPTDRYIMGKNNVAHVAPFCENSFNNNLISQDEATINCVSNLQKSESVIKYENPTSNTISEFKENSIMKTTEMFIRIEKKYYQQHSVIKTVPSANNIVTKLRRPVRSIFSPMSDHGKEDDEPIERACDKELDQTVSSQEDNLKPSNSLNQDDCFDLEIGSEDQLMDVDLSDQCETNKISTTEIVHEESHQGNDIKISQNESYENSCSQHLHTNGKHAVDRNSTAIDDALELMGLSNTKSVETMNNNLIYSSRNEDTAGCSLSYLEESSENDAGIEEQLASEEVGANLLIIKQIEKNSEKETIYKEQPLHLQIENLNVLEETGTLERGMLDVDTQNKTTTMVSKTGASKLEENTLCSEIEQNSQVTISHDSERQMLNSNNTYLAKTNPDDCNVNEILLNQSSCQSLSNESELIANTSDGSTGTTIPTIAESEDNVSYCTGNGLIGCDENNAGEIQVDDSESRLETSVIVRNKTFYNMSSKNVHPQKTHNHHQESSKSYIESVFNVRNIINEVIDDAVSKDVNHSQYYFKTPLKNELIKTPGSSCSKDEASPLINVKDSTDYTDNHQDTILKCSFEAENYNTFGTHQHCELKRERKKFVTDKKALVTTSKIVLPLDLTTSQTVWDNRFSSKDSYCVSESVSLREEKETSLFVTNFEASYFHEFKKRKWQRFYKSFFKRDCSETEDYLSCQQEEIDCNIPKSSFDHKQMKLLPTGNVCTVESSDCMIDTPDSPSSEIEMNDDFYSDNNSKQNLNNKKSFRESDEDFSTVETENREHTGSKTTDDSAVKPGDEASDENQAQDLSIPLKDKVHFFNQKETHSFLRRDSLKLLEREAVLKEIFSPDPEIDNSESKENEYPGGYDQHKQESGVNHVDCGSNMSNAVHISSVDGSSKESLISDSESLCNFPQQAQEVPNHNNSYSSLCQTITVESNHTKVILSSEEIDLKNDTITDKSSCQEPEVLQSQLQPQNNARALDIVESDSKNTTSLSNTSDLSQLTDNFQDYVGHLSQPQLSEMESSSTHCLPTAFENMSGLVEQNAEKVSQLFDAETSTKDVINKEKTSISFAEVDNVTLSQSDGEHSANDRSGPVSPLREESSLLCQGKEIISSDQQEISNETPGNDTDINKTNMSYCHDSNTNDISSKIIQNEDANPIALVTGKDVLFSTTQTSDEQDDEALNTSLHHKETPDRVISYDEDEREETNIISCHNDKINSVQDSLRNNQHMNKETFPLQCLVEAALALEHVDSKQMLLNNSNFPGLYSQADEGFVESPLSDSPSHETQEYLTKINSTDINLGSNDKKKSLQNDLTIADREIFSKFEETNYNLRASTRIVTSSSSNIIPYSKRKYGLKSAKPVSTTSEVKQKKVDTLVSDKIKSKKRKSVFAYPRSKRRRKNNKDKQKSDVVLEPINQNNTEIPLDTVDYEQMHDKFDKENILGNQSEVIESCLPKDLGCINCSDHCSHFKTNSQLTKSSTHLAEDESKNDFGGPLLIASENTASQGNIFCVHVDSEKMDDYVSNLNIGGLGILSDNNHSLFKDNNSDSIGSDIPNVSLENGTSLVIIIEDLDDNSGKIQFDDHCKSESDVMLGSVRDADCSDVLTTELSINESCICPPDIGMKGTCESEFKSKLSYGRSDELLTTNCYEEINENLINDIGNWPFVEEEVAEFDNKSEFPNNIPEEGRKIELKCSLPWKKIFNISKDVKEKQEKKKKKKNKASRKSSGLELGPAKVEVRLKAPSAEWKVISDYHENSSPVVKVSRLILQRESDNSSSSYSEKDSEEENEHKKQCSECSELKSYVSHGCESYLAENISKNENWQPIVVLKRSKELDELTSRLQSQTFSSLSNSQSSSSDEGKGEESSEDSDSDTSDDDDCRCSQSRESSLSSDLFENKVISDPSKKYYQNKFCETNENDGVRYEKYSPTGCSNSLANEKIYSPSNPHFSPGEVYPDSDVNSNCGVDKVSSNCDNAVDDVFIDEATCITNTDQQVICVENKIAETDHSDSNDVDQFGEENITDINRLQSKIEIMPQSIFTEISDESPTDRIPSNDYSSDLNDSSPHKNTNSEDEMGNTTVDYKSSVYSNSSSTSNEVKNTCNLSREFPYDQTKKTKRKMPKNFFVRKKVRRNQSEMASTDATQVVFSSENSNPNTTENSPSSPSIAQSELQIRKHSLSEENKHISESDLSVSCDNSRLHSVHNLEQSSPTRLNESSLTERFEEKRTLRNCGRGLKRPGEGHSREDTKRRRKKLRSLSNTCQECEITFKNKVELTRHNAYKHARRRELHHCLLCQRSFSSAARHSLHVQGRSHRHLELTQRHTVHAIHRLVAGHDCPAIPPLTRTELRALQWRPSQPGYTHVYHDTAPLHAVLQEQSSELSEDTILSGEKIVDD